MLSPRHLQYPLRRPTAGESVSGVSPLTMPGTPRLVRRQPAASLGRETYPVSHLPHGRRQRDTHLLITSPKLHQKAGAIKSALSTPVWHTVSFFLPFFYTAADKFPPVGEHRSIVAELMASSIVLTPDLWFFVLLFGFFCPFYRLDCLCKICVLETKTLCKLTVSIVFMIKKSYQSDLSRLLYLTFAKEMFPKNAQTRTGHADETWPGHQKPPKTVTVTDCSDAYQQHWLFKHGDLMTVSI